MQCTSLYHAIFLISRYICSDMRVATLTFFLNFHLHRISFSIFSFSFCMSLSLNWVAFRQYIHRSCFCIIQPVCVFWLEGLIHLHLNNYIVYSYWYFLNCFRFVFECLSFLLCLMAEGVPLADL